MDDETFSQLVQEGIAALPEKFRDKIENVAFLIADQPSRKQRKDNHLGKRDTLLGLYQGIPQTERGAYYDQVLPDTITIFKNPILEMSEDPETIKQIVADTVWHEVGHHFGLNEDEVRTREQQRQQASKKV